MIRLRFYIDEDNSWGILALFWLNLGYVWSNWGNWPNFGVFARMHLVPVGVLDFASGEDVVLLGNPSNSNSAENPVPYMWVPCGSIW